MSVHLCQFTSDPLNSKSPNCYEKTRVIKQYVHIFITKYSFSLLYAQLLMNNFRIDFMIKISKYFYLAFFIFIFDELSSVKSYSNLLR